MLFDTDVFIWVQRGNLRAAELVDATEKRYISTQTYMELLAGAQNKAQLRRNKDFLKSLDFTVLPFTENIGHRAAIYIELYALSHHMRAADALIAATATETGLTLVTANGKHYKHIPDLELLVLEV